MAHRKLSRRDFLRAGLTGAGLLSLDALLEACGVDLMRTFGSTMAPTTLPEVPTLVQPADTPASSAEDTTVSDQTETTPTNTPAALPDLVVARGGEPEDLVRRAMTALGGMERFIPASANVVIKPNICVAGRTYEYAATTNPWVVGTLVKLALDAGAASVKVMDSPFNGPQDQAYQDSGIKEQVEAAGGKMVNMDTWRFVMTKNSAAKLLKLTAVHEDILNADVLINVPIAKNHGSEARLTLGMKNLMGVVQDRAALHISLVQCIADLAALVRPQLTVIDAVRILTRNGPRGGRLADVQKLDTVIASPDIVAADSYAASLFGLSPEDIHYIAAAVKLGVGRSDLENLNIQEV